jgi:NAD(P)H-flavin reductase
MKPQQYTGVITQKLKLTKTVYQFVIQHQEPKELVFTPGQYATFIIDPQTRRQYSFCSAPTPSSFELVVDVAPMGVGSKYFLEKKVGDQVEYLAPLGQFGMMDTPLKKIFIATGTGIAPFRSMILRGKEITNHKSQIPNISQIPNFQNNSQLGTRNLQLSLYWGLRYEDDVYWDREIRNIVGQYTGFQYFLVLSKPGETWKGLHGHVTDYVFNNEKDLQNCEFYLCGNSAMITEVKNKLSALNVPDERIRIDMFY